MTATDGAKVQPRELPLHISKELCQGHIYIVTGANVGLGKEAARHLVAVGASKVIMAVRNVQSGEDAKADIESTTGIKGVAEVWQLDLSSYASVREFASKAIKSLERIEALIENAGVAVAGTEAEGLPTCLTVNVVSTFLLPVLLLPKLRADAAKFGYKPRISIVTSGTAFDMRNLWEKVADDPIQNMAKDENLGLGIYPGSKMLEILGVKHVAEVLPVARGGVIINSINPGLCETTLSRNAPPEFRAQLAEMWAKSGRTSECGSRTLLAGAVAGDDSHGAYMNNCLPADDLVPDWINATSNKQCWDGIAKELEKIEPGCVGKALE